MGDIIETKVTAFQPYLYYKLYGNGMWFDIKAHNKALIGLSNNCGRSQYLFEFGNSASISIFEASELKATKSGLPFTLSLDNYSRFWIDWDCNSIRAGIGHSNDVVVSCHLTTQPNYFTLLNKDTVHPCFFRFELPPLCLRMPSAISEPQITAGKLQWKSCDNQLPDETVIGGYINGEIVYVVRAHHRRSLTPGVFIPSEGLAFIPWGGSDNPTQNFEALCGFNLKWKPASARHVPVDAIIAGYSEVNREPLFIGRARHEDNIIPGKVQISHKVCYIAHGREISVKKFEVLTEPGLNARCANIYFEDFDEDARDDDSDDDDDDERMMMQHLHEL